MSIWMFGRLKPEPVWSEADRLERELGLREAVRAIRRRIAEADRVTRQRLYKIHDELVRRGPVDPARFA